MGFEVSRGTPERLERLLEAFGALLELSWELSGPLGALESSFGGLLDPLGALLEPKTLH